VSHRGHPEKDRSVDGAAFALDLPEAPTAIWGDEENVAWASGEPLMIAGPIGVAKTTLAERLALHRAGIRRGDLLGMPVRRSDGRVLYIAADRPRQAARSLRRMVDESDRQRLRSRLLVWSGPLPFDLGRAEPGQFLDWIEQYSEVQTAIVDSLKDVAVKLTDDEVGARVNAERQRVVAADYELVEIHHQRKASPENRRPRQLDDVYGSTWLTAGVGSVLLLWAKPGDPLVELRHLKQPAGEIGPHTVAVDHAAGEMRLHQPVELKQLVAEALNGGLTVRDAATHLFGSPDPDRDEIEKARRRLEALPGAVKVEGDPGEPTRYRPVERRTA
jgi:replicative DNA helicase